MVLKAMTVRARPIATALDHGCWWRSVTKPAFQRRGGSPRLGTPGTLRYQTDFLRCKGFSTPQVKLESLTYLGNDGSNVTALILNAGECPWRSRQ